MKNSNRLMLLGGVVGAILTAVSPVVAQAPKGMWQGGMWQAMDANQDGSIDRAEFDRIMRVNVHGVFYPSQLAARHMMQHDGGAILMTASTSGVVAYRHYADYNASKGAIIAMMRTMALELAPKVRVNAVNPGYTLTPMQEAEYSPAMLRSVNDAIPMGRHARPEELAGLFAYLASDEAAYATGQVFTLDGGESTGTLAGKLSMSEM